MSILNGIKDWFGRRALLKEARQDRSPLPKNLAVANKVGMLYVAHDEQAHTQVRNYVKKIKEELGLTRIMALGYFPGKALPFHLHTKLNFDAICLKDLNWYRIPQGNTVQNFMAEEYEIIIDLTMEDRLPIQYIMAKSRARFKVGRWSESNKKILDMMIDMAGSRSLPQMIQQVHHYLLMVNSKPEPSLN
jgi:hypothetical protein